MKNFLLFLSFGLFLSLNVMSQLDTTGYVNYLKNGDFEEKGAWQFAVNDGDSSDVTWEFGVFPGPAYGEDACLEVSWDNMSTPLNQILYQVVKVAIGDTFYFNGAFKDAGTAADINQVWFQIIILPVNADNDSSVADGILAATNAWQDNDATILLNHAKGWGVDWLALGKNTTFEEDMNPDAIYGHNVGIGDFDGQGDTIIYTVPDTLFWYAPDTYTVLGQKGDSIDLFVAFQVGQWMDQGSGIVNSFDFKFDSFVLLGPPKGVTSVPQRSIPEIKIYPNPVSDILLVENNEILKSITISNVVGQKIRTISDINERKAEINMSNLQGGIYIITSVDITGQTYTVKVLKK
jgi:hypothetical protein